MSGIVSALSNLPTTLPGAGGGVVFDGYGGVINQIGASETAFVHRNAVACAQYSITYPTTQPSPSTTSSGVVVARPSPRPVLAGHPGLVPELHRPDPGRLAAGLLRSEPAPAPAGEAHYDPDDVFHFAQSIPPG